MLLPTRRLLCRKQRARGRGQCTVVRALWSVLPRLDPRAYECVDAPPLMAASRLLIGPDRHHPNAEEARLGPAEQRQEVCRQEHPEDGTCEHTWDASIFEHPPLALSTLSPPAAHPVPSHPRGTTLVRMSYPAFVCEVCDTGDGDRQRPSRQTLVPRAVTPQVAHCWPIVGPLLADRCTPWRVALARPLTHCFPVPSALSVRPRHLLHTHRRSGTPPR